MTKSAQLNVRLEPEVKESAEAVFNELGITASQAVSMFFRQVSLQNGLPFEVKIPNAETVAALRDLEEGRDVQRYDSVEELFKDAGI